MNILGVSVSHEANACIFVDNKLVAGAAEERFSRIKMDMTYPKLAVDFCMRYANLKPEDLDYVVLVTEDDIPDHYMVNRIANFGIDDYVREQHDYWKPKLFEKKKLNYLEVFKDKISQKDEDLAAFVGADMPPEERYQKFLAHRKRRITDHLGIDASKIVTVKHERAHAFYGLYSSPLREKTLVLTCEGAGEYSNSTVSLFDGRELKEITHTMQNHIGHLYKFITLLLGMKPTQHEYKVMGLAPYANVKEVEKAYEVFKDIFKLDGLNVGVKNRPEDYYFWFQRKLEGCRFDGIAGALQKAVEEIMVKWVTHCCKELDVANVILSGGVAQNIKACQLIGEIDEVKSIFISPASGDGSLSIGGVFGFLDKIYAEKNIPKDRIEPMTNPYLGPEYSPKEVEDAIKKADLGSQFEVVEGIDRDFAVRQLLENKVIARISGRVEFGQRALGNRSIIANPKDPRMIRKLNSKIKFRDFWMPFTPTVLKEYEDRYLINPKKLQSPFMTLAFHTTPEFQERAAAAIHPADDTARPQILERATNPGYYDLIQAFAEQTGTGALLNTSLNLHGEPMVCSPEDGIHTFLNSEIDVLLFDEIAVLRPTGGKSEGRPLAETISASA